MPRLMSEGDGATPSRSTLLESVGALTARAARGVGNGLASAYRAVDADVPRHLAELPLLGLVSLAARRVSPVALPDDGYRPVIFVHGLGGFRGNFTPARLYLRLRGRSRTYAVGFPPDVDLEGMGLELRRFIAEVLAVNGLGDNGTVDLVAHSMGGLVARIAIEDHRTRARVATLVTLGTPHAGTHAARYAQTPFVLPLRPDSDLMRRLARQVPWTAPPRLVTFWSDSDVFLLPASTARVDGAESVEMPGTTHYGYLLHAACFRRIEDALSGVGSPSGH